MLQFAYLCQPILACSDEAAGGVDEGADELEAPPPRKDAVMSVLTQLPGTSAAPPVTNLMAAH